MNLSYLMGAEEVTNEELESLGVEIVETTPGGSRMLKVSDEALPKYIELVKEKLTKGFWNEIVEPKEILFIFKFKDGHIEEYVLNEETMPKIDKLAAEFNDEPPGKTQNVYKYLSENTFYHDFMMENYKSKINS